MRENLCKEMSVAIQRLLNIASNLSFNNISDNCTFIISEIVHSHQNFFEQNKIRKSKNENKTPKSFTNIIDELEILYHNIYDINLSIYRASKCSTIVEIQLFLRSSLDLEFQNKTVEQETMLHCKVAIPPYATENKEKFDINWQLGTLNHKWKMFRWNFKILYKKIRKLNKNSQYL